MNKRLISVLLCFLITVSIISSGIATVIASAETEELLISNCDTLDGWNKTSGNKLTVSPNGFGSGSNAISCDINCGAFRDAIYTSGEPIDISKYENIEWDVMMHTAATAGMWDDISSIYGDEVYLKIGSSLSDYNVYRLSKMTVEQDAGNSLWYHFSIDIDNPSSTTGSFNLSSMKIFAFTTKDGAVNSSVRNGNIRIDNIYARNLRPEKPEEINDIVLSECETTDNWSYAGSIALQINPNGMTNSALHIYAGYAALRKLTFSKNVDLSKHNTIEFDMFCMKNGDVSFDMWSSVTEAYSDKIGFEITAGSGTNKYEYDKLDIKSVGNNWYHITVNLLDPTSKTGSLDLAKFGSLSFYTNTTTSLNTGLGDAIYRIDNLTATYNKDASSGSDDETDGNYPIPGVFEKETTGTFSFISKDFNYDLSKYNKSQLYLTMKITVTNTDGTDNILDFTSEGQVELTSSGGSDRQELNWTVPKLGLKSGVNNIRLQLSSAEFDNGFNLSSVNFFRFYSKQAGDAVYNVKIEDIMITDVKEQSVVGTYFSDGMMFKQNAPMNIFGKTEGSEVKALLYKGEEKIQEKTVSAETDGDWRLSFDGRNGGYDFYKIEIYVDGALVKTINDILIGELWLAAGQSNMEYFVLQTIKDYDYSLIPLNSYVRFYDEPLVPGGVSSVLPSSPVSDIEGAKWANGSNAVDVKYISAIAYYMSLQLQTELNVPVGFINAAKGASVIESWLPRESVENDSVIKGTLEKRGIYKTAAQLDKITSNWTYLTTLYNSKIAPLSGINISGLLWYQGESNIKYADEDGYNTFYEHSLTALIDSYSKLFGYENGEMPVALAHLAPYNYISIRSDHATILASFSEMLSNVTAKVNAEVMQIPIYDLPLTYKDPPINNPDPIHPNSKLAVGERFADAVLASCYGKGNKNAGTAPTVSSVKFNGNKAVLTFDNVGDGLKIANGEKSLRGFAVAGSNRVFVKAEAKIISADTVEVYSTDISSPVAVTYAWSSYNMHSSLANSLDIPAVPYRSDKVPSVYAVSDDWTYFDSDTTWEAVTSLEAGYKNAYSSDDNTVLSFTAEGALEGNGHMKVDYRSGKGSFTPVLNLGGMVNQLQSYTGISVYVKNPDNRTKKLSLAINAGGETYKATVVTGNKLSNEYEITSDDYKKYTFNLKRITNSEGKVLIDSTTVLKTAESLNFTISDSTSGTLYFDNAAFNSLPLPTPGSQNDVLVDGVVDTTPGSIDENGNMWFGDAETKNGWSATGAQVDLSTDLVTQGKHSVGTVAKDGVLKQIVYSPGVELDVSAYDYLEFDVYYSNMEWFNASTSLMFELTSSGSSDNESNRYMKGYLSENAPEMYSSGAAATKTPGWYHVRLNLKSPQSQARGGMNLKKCNYFRFYTIGAPEGTADFEIRIDNMKFTKIGNGSNGGNGSNKNGDPSYGVEIDSSSMWMSMADTAIWWKASGTDAVIDTVNKTQGKASVSAVAKGGVLKQLAFIPEYSIDVSKYQYLEFDAYFTNIDWLNACEGMMFELTSAGTCDKESSRYTKSSMLEACPALAADYENGTSGGKWYHFKLNLATPHSKVGGGLKTDKFNYFRFYTVNAKSGTSDYTVYFDNMKFTKGEVPPSVIKQGDTLIINSADSAAMWTSPGQEVMVDTKNKVSGSGSVSVIAKNGILKELAYHPAEPIDLTGYHYLQFDLFLSDISCLNTSTGFMVELTSSGKCDYESNRYMKSAILAACPELAADLSAGEKGNKWYHFCFNLDRPQNQVRGGLDIKAMNFFRIYFLGSPEGTPDCVVNLDNLIATVNGKDSSLNTNGSGQQISISPGGGTNKNIALKTNMGMKTPPLAEYPHELVRTAAMLGVGVLILLVSFGVFSLIVLVKMRKCRR